MTSYAVDSKRQAMRATGIVDEVKEWEERDGKRRPSEIPLWSVEVIYKQTSWGRESSVTGRVIVGMPQRPVLEEYARVEFVDLRAEVRVNQAGGLVESWSADGVADGKPATASTPAGAGKAA